MLLVVSLVTWLIAALSTTAAAAPDPIPAPAPAPALRPASPNLLGGPVLASAGVVVGSRASSPPPDTTAASWLIADADSGAVLAARDAHGPHLPASTLKILTALAVLPRLSPAQEVTISTAAASVDGTRVGLVPGMTYTVAELATAMIVASGNDAAVALAEAAGGADATVVLMNRTAAELNARDTTAGDPSGLDAPGQTTSAYDLALLGRAALANPIVRRFLTIPRATVRGRDGKSFEIQNHNDLLASYPGTIGVKNGYTAAAGATYIGAVRRGGHTLILTMLRAAPAYAKEARPLLDWGFANVDTIAPVGHLVVKSDETRGLAMAPDGSTVDGLGPLATADAGTGTGGRHDTGAHDYARRQSQRRDIGDHGIGPATWIAIAITLIFGLFTLRRRLSRRHLFPNSDAFPNIDALPGMAARPPVPTAHLLRSGNVSTSRVRLVPHRRGGGEDGTPTPGLRVGTGGGPSSAASPAGTSAPAGTAAPAGTSAPAGTAVPDGGTSDE